MTTLHFSKAEFSAWWAVLCDRFGAKNEQTMKIYYSILAAELTREQMQTALRMAFRFEDFWPKPQRFIDLGCDRPDFKARAVAMWDELYLESAGPHGLRDRAKSPEVQLLKLVTIGQSLGAIPSDKLYWMRKDFVDRYRDQLEAAEVTTAREAMRALSMGEPDRELPVPRGLHGGLYGRDLLMEQNLEAVYRDE